MEIFVVAILIGLIPAFIAKSKGKSFGLWWVYGAALFIVALPHALLMAPDRATLENQQRGAGMKKCPWCAEMIQGDAIACRYCGRDVGERREPPVPPAPSGPAGGRYNFPS